MFMKKSLKSKYLDYQKHYYSVKQDKDIYCVCVKPIHLFDIKKQHSLNLRCGGFFF